MICQKWRECKKSGKNSNMFGGNKKSHFIFYSSYGHVWNQKMFINIFLVDQRSTNFVY